MQEMYALLAFLYALLAFFVCALLAFFLFSSRSSAYMYALIAALLPLLIVSTRDTGVSQSEHGARHDLMNSWLSLGVHLDMIFTRYEDKYVDSYITEWGYTCSSMRTHI